MPGYPPYDLAKAKELVQQLGGLTVNLGTIQNLVAQETTEALQTEWEAAGIKTTIANYPLAGLIAQFTSSKWQAMVQTAGAYDPAAGVGVASGSPPSRRSAGCTTRSWTRCSPGRGGVSLSQRCALYNQAAAYIAKNYYGPFYFGFAPANMAVKGVTGPGITEPLPAVVVTPTILWEDVAYNSRPDHGDSGGSQGTGRTRRGNRARRARPSARLAGRRLLAAIPVLLGVTFLTFAVMNLLPGNAAQELLGANATPGAGAPAPDQLRLDQPFWDRYGTGSAACCTGTSARRCQRAASPRSWPAAADHRGAAAVRLRRVDRVRCRPGGARRAPAERHRRPDQHRGQHARAVHRAVRARAPADLHLRGPAAAGSRPSATSLTQNPGSNFKSLTLPAAAIGFPLFAVYTRLLRADIVEQMQREDYIVTAKAKGVAALAGPAAARAAATRCSASSPLVGLNLGTLVGAAAIIEPIFSLPGIGAT